jgi:hypothetical protein
MLNIAVESLTLILCIQKVTSLNLGWAVTCSEWNASWFSSVFTYCNVLGLFYIHDGTLLHSKSQYTTVKHSQQLFGHTYTSDLHGLGTLIPIEFFQQDVLWQSSNTHSHPAVMKLPNTRRDNPSSGYRPTCTPQRHLGVYSLNLH